MHNYPNKKVVKKPASYQMRRAQVWEYGVSLRHPAKLLHGTLVVMLWQMITGKGSAPSEAILNNLGVEGSWGSDFVVHEALILEGITFA
jgi:hypothetical protein